MGRQQGRRILPVRWNRCFRQGHNPSILGTDKAIRNCTESRRKAWNLSSFPQKGGSMTALYDAYLAQGGPALPEGYSFEIKSSRYFYTQGFAILGPKSKIFRTRRRQSIGALDNIKWWKMKSDGQWDIDPDAQAWTVWMMQLTYGMWRSQSYKQDLEARYSAYNGVHP